jgi:dihydroorotate dehydrogenase (fumarate)
MSSIDLSTTYLGLRLANPFIAGASPLGDHMDTVRRLEDAGCAAIVLHSLFEEQIEQKATGRIHHMDPQDRQFATVVSYFPEPDQYALGPDEYLEHLRKIKGAVQIPVMASLNGVTPGGWISFAHQAAQAGADGIELHIYHAASDMTSSAADVERAFVDIVREVKRTVRIPVAVKMAPVFTAFAHFARQIDDAGADGIVLFTRFGRADIDVEQLEITRRMPLSDSSALAARLRGAAALSGRVRASIAITGGIHSGLDVIKATMAGAHATQMVSALLRHGPGHLRAVKQDVEAWMQEHEWPSLDEMRGNMSLGRLPDPAAYERANFRMSLR